jgi:putative spermidine/putrescine transport system permease protein
VRGTCRLTHKGPKTMPRPKGPMPNRLYLFLMIAPAVAVIGILFGGGLIFALMRSFNYMPVIGLTDPNLQAYAHVLTDPDFLLSFLLTFHIAFTSTALSALIALAAAMMIRATTTGRRTITFLFQLNLTVPHTVGAIGILYLFSQSGTFARLGYNLSVIAKPADFPALVFDPAAIGIILHYVWKEVPFIGLILLAQMQIIGTNHESTARTLGATPAQAFRHALLPLLMPALTAASIITFAFAFGAYEIPALLGASYPQALPVLAYRSFTDVDLASRPDAMAMAVIITLISALLIWAYTRALTAMVRT